MSAESLRTGLGAPQAAGLAPQAVGLAPQAGGPGAAGGDPRHEAGGRDVPTWCMSDESQRTE
jgi:hypothetical protein